MPNNHCILSMRRISKRYGDMYALSNVDFDLYAVKCTAWWGKTARANPPDQDPLRRRAAHHRKH